MPPGYVFGVIFGGQSGEHEVSLASARSVIAALDPRNTKWSHRHHASRPLADQWRPNGHPHRWAHRVGAG